MTLGGPRSGVLGVTPRLCMKFALCGSESHRSPSPTTPSPPRLALYNLVSPAWSPQPGLHSPVSKRSLTEILSPRGSLSKRNALQEDRFPRGSVSKMLAHSRSMGFSSPQSSPRGSLTTRFLSPRGSLSMRFCSPQDLFATRFAHHKVPPFTRLSKRFTRYKVRSPGGSAL